MSFHSSPIYGFVGQTNYSLFTCKANLDLRLAALLSWITFFFANLSNIATTFGNNSTATVLSVVIRNFFTAFRVVFA